LKKSVLNEEPELQHHNINVSNGKVIQCLGHTVVFFLYSGQYRQMLSLCRRGGDRMV